MTLKRIILWSASLLLAANCLTGCLAGKFMTNYALKPAQHGEADIERTRAKADSLAPGVMAWYDDLHAKGIFKDITRTDPDGHKLHAVYAPAKDPATAQGTAIVVHGYTDNHLVFMYLVRMYRDEFNYNVMVARPPGRGRLGRGRPRPLQGRLHRRARRVHGRGHRDDDERRRPPVLHPRLRRGLRLLLRLGPVRPQPQGQLPPAPVPDSASIVSKQRYGWGFKEASSVDQLAKCDRPMLFIHGTEDDFVPVDHVFKNYEAKTHGYKELVLVPGAVHANSYAKDPKNYTWRVKYFLDRVKSGEIK